MQFQGFVRGLTIARSLLGVLALFVSFFLATAANAVVVSAQPSSVTLSSGDSHTFRISATASSGGGTVYYNWYRDGVRLSATSSSLTISSASQDNDGTYSCMVRDAVSTYVCNSFSVTLSGATSSQSLTFTRQPVSQSVNAGSTASFSVAVSGTGTLRYQWYFNGAAMADAPRASTLSLASVSSANAGNYYVTVRRSGETATVRSATATLTVNAFDRVSITQQPVGTSVDEGSPAAFSVAATGSGTLSYQWYFNGTAISGATSSTLRLSSASLSNAGTYYAVVRNSGSSATSTAVALAVSPYQRVSITAQPASQSVTAGTAVALQVAATGSGTLSYQWYFNGAAISGATASSLRFSSAATTNSGSYYVVVRNSASSATSSTASLTVASATTPVSITTQPASQIVNEGSTVQMIVAATGSGTLSYQWYRNGTALSGATASSLSLSNVTSNNAGSYYAVVRNASSSATSSTATLSVMATSTTYSASLGWTRPTLREDGTPLASSDIAGFNLYYATSSTGTMTRIASLTGTQLSYVVNNLAAGAHYFALSTVDDTGLESSLSGRALIRF